MKLNELSAGSKFRINLGDKITKNIYIVENSSCSPALYYYCSDSDGSIVFISCNTDVIPILIDISSLKIGDTFIFDHTLDHLLCQQHTVQVDDVGFHNVYCLHPVSKTLVAINKNKQVRVPLNFDSASRLPF